MIEMDLKEDAVNANAEGVSAHWSASETTTSTCESYAEKYSETNFSSSYTKNNDPCFGYTTSCCEDSATTGGCCYWKSTAWCLGTNANSDCDENDGSGCPACCASTPNMTAECTPTSAPTTAPPTTAKPTTTAAPTPKPTTTAAPTPKPTTTTEPPTVAETTAAPTMHSAKKWTMLHPDYQGGDGELLWSIYY